MPNSNPGDDLAPNNPEIFVTPLVRLDGIVDEMQGYLINPEFLPPASGGVNNQWQDIANNGIDLVGDGSLVSPYRVDFNGADLPLTANYDETKNIVIDDSTVMPAIKAGTNVTIAIDGTLSASAVAGLGPKYHTSQFFDVNTETFPVVLDTHVSGNTNLAMVSLLTDQVLNLTDAAFDVSVMVNGGILRIMQGNDNPTLNTLSFTDTHGVKQTVSGNNGFMTLQLIGTDLFVIGAYDPNAGV